MGEIRIFLSFYVKISQNLLKFLGKYKKFHKNQFFSNIFKFWRITLKNVKMLLKN